MDAGPTKKQVTNWYDFSRTSQIAGRFNVNAKDVQQLRKNIRGMGLETEKVHEIVDALKEEDLI